MLDVSANFINLVFRWIFGSLITSFELLAGKTPSRAFKTKSVATLAFLFFIVFLTQLAETAINVIHSKDDWVFLIALRESVILGTIFSSVIFFCFRNIYLLSLVVQVLVTTSFLSLMVQLTPWHESLQYLPFSIYFILVLIAGFKSGKKTAAENQ